MVITMYEIPLPNKGERYDLSVEELNNLLYKAYRNGFDYAREVYGNKVITTTNTPEGEWVSEWR